jgi:hypothetical protein
VKIATRWQFWKAMRTPEVLFERVAYGIAGHHAKEFPARLLVRAALA